MGAGRRDVVPHRDLDAAHASQVDIPQIPQKADGVAEAELVVEHKRVCETANLPVEVGRRLELTQLGEHPENDVLLALVAGEVADSLHRPPSTIDQLLGLA